MLSVMHLRRNTDHHRDFARMIALVVSFAVGLGVSNARAQTAPQPPAASVVDSPPDRDELDPIEESGSRMSYSLLQNDFPAELILPPPTRESLRKAARFIPREIDPELPLRLVVGRPKVLQLAATPKRIYTPTDEIVRTEIIDEQSGREVVVTGLQPGTTTLIFWFNDDSVPSGQSTVAYEVQVFADPLLAQPTQDLEQELNEKFPNSYIQLDEIADRLIVEGQVPDALEMSQILNVLVGARRPQQTQRALTESRAISNSFDFSTAAERETAQRDAAFANRILDAQNLAAAGIINRMKVVGEQQVMLKVTVAEVNRSAARTIGLNFGINNSSGTSVFQNFTGNLIGGGAGGGAGGAAGGGGTSTANVLASLDMGQVQLAVEALRNLNLSRTLAEPNMIALNGETADFQVGGSFPIPVIGGAGGGANNLQGVTFVPFGVQLQFTPNILDRDIIRLQIQAEVSTRDESVGTSVGGGAGGTSVSGLNTRNFSSTVQLRSGQTIAVAGLMQTNFGSTSDRIPFWGDLPFIGSTGGVNGTSSGEQELVILVTPHLVAPIDANEALPLPGNDVFEPTDIEFFIANRLESRRSRDFRASVRTDFDRLKRAENCCPERYMIGEIGPTDRCSPSPLRTPHQPTPSIQATISDESTGDSPPQGSARKTISLDQMR